MDYPYNQNSASGQGGDGDAAAGDGADPSYLSMAAAATVAEGGMSDSPSLQPPHRQQQQQAQHQQQQQQLLLQDEELMLRQQLLSTLSGQEALLLQQQQQQQQWLLQQQQLQLGAGGGQGQMQLNLQQQPDAAFARAASATATAIGGLGGGGGGDGFGLDENAAGGGNPAAAAVAGYDPGLLLQQHDSFAAGVVGDGLDNAISAGASSSAGTPSPPFAVAGSASKKKGGAKGKGIKKPKDMPKRPLSAYNIFFKDERARILASIPAPVGYPGPEELPDEEQGQLAHRGEEEEGGGGGGGKSRGGEGRSGESTVTASLSSSSYKRPPHGKISFENLAKTIARNWKTLGTDDPSRLAHYKELAAEDMRRYKREMDDYHVAQAHKRKREEEEEIVIAQREAQRRREMEENERLRHLERERAQREIHRLEREILEQQREQSRAQARLAQYQEMGFLPPTSYLPHGQETDNAAIAMNNPPLPSTLARMRMQQQQQQQQQQQCALPQTLTMAGEGGMYLPTNQQEIQQQQQQIQELHQQEMTAAVDRQTFAAAQQQLQYLQAFTGAGAGTTPGAGAGTTPGSGAGTPAEGTHDASSMQMNAIAGSLMEQKLPPMLQQQGHELQRQEQHFPDNALWRVGEEGKSLQQGEKKDERERQQPRGQVSSRATNMGESNTKVPKAA